MEEIPKEPEIKEGPLEKPEETPLIDIFNYYLRTRYKGVGGVIPPDLDYTQDVSRVLWENR